MSDLFEIESNRIKYENFGETFFVDISKVSPKFSKDIPIIRNSNAVIESVYNILLTEPGERIMDPKFGTNLRKYVFEHCDSETASFILVEVESAIRLYETRAQEVEITITPLPDANTFQIDIQFEIISGNEIATLSTTLEKIR